ncbi:MAG: ATP-binding cassette, subfamily bacterial, partial [Mycobacterium sp.]|nr:ATP-binding cassette, subfamily bacterial [Mycobacterium sp.]
MSYTTGSDEEPHESKRLDPMDVYMESASQRVSARRLPHVVASALRLTWEASRRGFLVAAGLQVLGALMVSALVAVGKLALDAIIGAGDGGTDVGRLIPVVVSLALVTAVGAAASTLQQQQQRLLGEEVSLTAWRRLLDVTGRVGLEFYESPKFYDQLQRV